MPQQQQDYFETYEDCSVTGDLEQSLCYWQGDSSRNQCQISSDGYLLLYPDSLANCPVLPKTGYREIQNDRLVFLNNPVEELQAILQYIRHGRVHTRVTYVYRNQYLTQPLFNDTPAAQTGSARW